MQSPNEIAAELLGNFFKYPNSWNSYKTKLLPEHFLDFGFIFTAMIKQEKITGELNFRAVAKDLSEHIQVIASIRDAAISEGRTDYLVDQLRKLKTRKNILQIADKLKLSVTEYDPTELINNLKNHLDELMVQDYPSFIDPDRDYVEFVDHVKTLKTNPKEFKGLEIGLTDVDGITNGWQRTDFIVIGARTSIGKSAFACMNVLNLAKNGHKCLYFSLEMSKKQVYARIAASAYNVHLSAIRNGQISDETLSRLEARDSFWKNIMVDDTRAVTSEYIADRMLEVKRTYGLDFVVVDYIQDVKEQGEHTDNTGSAIARICRKLRKSAQEADCAVMAMSQVVRDVEKRVDKRPNNSDLSGSTGIETSADVIGILYRDDYYNPDTPEQNVLELMITKHRNGSLGLVKLYYDKSTQQLRSYVRPAFETPRSIKRPTRKENHIYG